MKKEFLPIGSICTLSKNNVKVMVSGYFSVDYSNDLKIFMYSAVPYPKGFSTNGNNYAFNESDIKTVDFLGYKDGVYEELNKKLSKVKFEELETIFNESHEDNNLKQALSFEFDENGYVIGVGGNHISVDNSTPIENPFSSDEKPVEIESNKSGLENVSDWPIFSGYKFDENGIVIGVEEAKTEEVESKEPNYKFDSNGIVVGTKDDEASLVGDSSKDVLDLSAPITSESDEEEVIEQEKNDDKVKNEISKYQFDEKGYVIENNAKFEDMIKTENKVVEPELKAEEVASLKFDENGVVVGLGMDDKQIDNKTKGYKFDENGVVIGLDE